MWRVHYSDLAPKYYTPDKRRSRDFYLSLNLDLYPSDGSNAEKFNEYCGHLEYYFIYLFTVNFDWKYYYCLFFSSLVL